MSIIEVTNRPRLLLLENALHKTGAFSVALTVVVTLRKQYDIELVLSTASTLRTAVNEAGIVCHVLPMIELGRSWRKLLIYLPALLFNTLKLRRLLSRCNADGLIVNDYYNLLGACIRLSGWQGKILTMVQLLPSNQHRIMNKIWTTVGLLFSSRLVAVSKAVAQQLPNNPKVIVLYNPVCYVEKYPLLFEPTYAKDGLVRCLYPANYIAGKGHEIALEAFALAWQVCPLLRLKFVGGDMGLEKNHALKLKLQVRATQLGVQDVVSIDDFSNDIEFEIKNSDIVLNFSQSESFSMTCAEASAFGRPIIATRCGGPEEIVTDGVTGLLVDIDDLASMKNAILKLASSKSIRQQFGNAGHFSIRERFSYKNFQVNFNKIWNELK